MSQFLQADLCKEHGYYDSFEHRDGCPHCTFTAGLTTIAKDHTAVSFYATAPGTPAREAEERCARERGIELRTLKRVEAAALGLLSARVPEENAEKPGSESDSK